MGAAAESGGQKCVVSCCEPGAQCDRRSGSWRKAVNLEGGDVHLGSGRERDEPNWAEVAAGAAAPAVNAIVA